MRKFFWRTKCYPHIEDIYVLSSKNKKAAKLLSRIEEGIETELQTNWTDIVIGNVRLSKDMYPEFSIFDKELVACQFGMAGIQMIEGYINEGPINVKLSNIADDMGYCTMMCLLNQIAEVAERFQDIEIEPVTFLLESDFVNEEAVAAASKLVSLVYPEFTIEYKKPVSVLEQITACKNGRIFS